MPLSLGWGSIDWERETFLDDICLYNYLDYLLQFFAICYYLLLLQDIFLLRHKTLIKIRNLFDGAQAAPGKLAVYSKSLQTAQHCLFEAQVENTAMET